MPDEASTKPAAKRPAAKPKPKPKPTAKVAAKTFPDAEGTDIKKGMRVALAEKPTTVLGTAAYRVTDGKRKVPRIGVALATTKAAAGHASIKGRTVKNRAFDADLLIVVQ
jgi:hypothetical protein